MPSVPFLGRRGPELALVDASSGREWSYDRLDDVVRDRAQALGSAGGVALLLCENDADTVIDYLAALSAGLAVMPLDAAIARDSLLPIVERYAPDLILGATDPVDGYADSGRTARRAGPVDPVCADLAILLSTSGSTGSPRMVRLTRASVAANTADIVDSLGIVPGDRAITSMPLHYSYGLSVLNSHLAAGATVVLSGASVLDPEFWRAVTEHAVTTFAGVPYTFAMLARLRFDPVAYPSIRAITQAGGRLDPERVEQYRVLLEAAGVKLYVMYGQTEAGPRITCLPAERLADKLGSVGRSMRSGSLHIDEVGSDLPAGTVGEIVYTGPNVMLGYADVRADLTCTDDVGGVLRTGDLGYLDEDGFLFVTGRIKRIAKLFGTRVSLDEVELLSAELGPVAVVGREDRLHVHHQNADAALVAAVRKQVSLQLKAPLAAIVMHLDDEFPVLPSGKVDYRSLLERDEAEATT